MENDKGIFVISLDFEMMWGAKDWSTPDKYGRSNVAQVSQVIDSLLRLFSEYGIHATFATVGFIFCHNKEDLLDNIPLKKPSYIDINLSPYVGHYIENIPNKYANLYFAPNLIRKISKTIGMEIATHTACHYNCSALGQTLEEFQEDLTTAIRIADRDNYTIKSIVFPRNQVDEEYLKICDQNGISIYRGNALKFFKKTRNRIAELKNRLCRLLDNYIPFDNSTTYPISTVIENNRYNVRASRFLRPYSHRLFFLEWLKCQRIKNEIIMAAKKGEIYHLWWHPHNFGDNINNNINNLEKILKYYKFCNEKYGMTSMNMQEIAKYASHHK